MKNLARWQEQAAEETTGHAESTQDLRRQQQLMSAESARHEATVKRVAGVHEQAASSVAGHAASHEDLSGSVGASSEEIGKLAKQLSSAENAMKRVKEGESALGGETDKLGERVDKALNNFDELSASFKNGSADLKTLRQDLSASGQELGNLSKRFETISADARLLRNASEEASSMAKSLSTLRQSSNQPILQSLGIDKARQDLRSLTAEYEQFNSVTRNQAEQEAARLTNRMFASRFGSVARQLPVGGSEFESAIQRQIQARARSTVPKATQGPRDFLTEGNTLVSKIGQLDQAAQKHTASNTALSAGYSQVASGLRKVIREFDIGSAEARKFGTAMEDAAKKAKNIDLARSSSGFGQFVQKLGTATDSIGIKIISLSAALRGARLAGLVGLFQPIITGLASLAGGFFSVASGAAQAGATIGGVFLSGLGQLIPMVSVGIAALIRLRDVFQAVQAAQAAKQESFFAPFQGIITQLQNTSQLIQSEQQLANSYYALQDAQVQVKESQIALTQARIDAIRNLQDLVLAEKSAELQLKQANLSVTQAEQQLAAARAGGSQEAIQQAQLGLQGAQISQQQATLGVPRAKQNLSLAQGYGVLGSPQVLSASQALRQSLLGVKEAYQQIGNAQRQVRITKLTLAEPASHMTQQQSTLQYLLGQMSSPEKVLFNELNHLESQLRSPNSPLKKITDYIIQPFVFAFQRLDTLLSNKSFMGPITKLAEAMGGQLRSIFGTMFGARGTSFFKTMATDASQSIPVVTKAITGLMKVFEDIATAAAPAFKQLSGDWARFWNAMDARDRTPQGQKRLTDFFNQGAKWAEDFAHLAGAIFGLFKALGHDAAPQGMKTVTTFTEAIHDATDWVKSHGKEVTNFFSQARQGLGLIGGVLFNIGKALLQVFNLTSLQAFSSFLNTVVIPAARDLANGIGFIVTNIDLLLNKIPFLKSVVEAVFVGYFATIAVNKMAGFFSFVTGGFGRLRSAIAGFKGAEGFFSKIGGFFKGGVTNLRVDGSSLEAPATKIATAGSAMQEAAGIIDKAADKMAAAADTQKGAAAAQDTAAGEQVAAGAEEETAAATQATAAVEQQVAGAETLGGGAVLGAEGVGAAGLLGTLGAGGVGGFASAALGPAALGAGAIYLALNTGGPKKGKAGVGLASLLGPIGGTHKDKNILDRLNPFNGTGFLGLGAATSSDQSSSTTRQLQALQSGLNGVTSPSQLNSSQIQSVYATSLKLLQMPDITATQRRALQEYAQAFNPVNAALKNLQSQWSSTFQGISATTGNVMQQVQQTLTQDIANISANLGTGTKQGVQALEASFSQAWQTVLDNTSAGVRGTASAISALNKMVNQALKALGQGGVTLGTGAGQINPGTAQGASVISGLASGQLTAGGAMSPHASGGWHSATPGGRIVQVGEGGHDEVTLTTDPKHAPRQSMLLHQYLQRVSPHMAVGGLVHQPLGYVNPIPGFRIGRTDMGVDANAAPGTPIGAIGDSKLVGVIPNWYQGQPLLNFQLLDGPDMGRFWYVAEQIAPITEAIGSIFKAGQMVARYAAHGTGIEIGWAGNASGTTLAQTQGKTGDSSHGNAPAGVAFRSFLGGLARGQIVGGSFANAVQTLAAPHVAGVHGAFGSIAQGIVNQVTNAANQYLSSVGGGSAGNAGTLPSLSGGSVASQIFRFFSTKGLGRAAIAGIIGNWMQESSLNPSAPGGGLAQWIGGRGAALSSLAQREGQSPSNAAVQLQYAWQELTGSQSQALSALRSSQTASQAAIAFSNIFERPGTPMIQNRINYANQAYAEGYAAGGLLTRHLRRMGLRHLRKKVMRFADGGRAPWGGEPIPIIAHDGERIANPSQWGEVARMAGTTPGGLDHHLGFDTGRPRQHFAGGGIAGVASAGSSLLSRALQLLLAYLGGSPPPLYTANAGQGHTTLPTTPTSLGGINSYLGNVSSNLFKADPGSVFGSFKILSQVLQSINNAVGDISKLPIKKQTTKMTKLIEAFADPNNPGSTLNLLATAFQRFQVNISGWVTSLGYRVSTNVAPTSIARVGAGGFAGTGFGGVTLAGPALTAGNIGTTGQTRLDALNVRASVEQTRYLQRETEATKKAISGVRKQMSLIQHSNLSKKTKTDSLAKLQSTYTELVTQQENLNSSINGQISTTFQNEQQYIQDTLSQVSDVYQTQQQQIQTKQSTAQALGQYGRLPSIDQALVDSAKAQIDALQKPLQEAQRSGNADLVAQIQQQISQLQQTIGATTAQMIQDAMSAIQQTAQTQQAKASMLQSLSQTMQQSAGSAGGIAAAFGVNAQALQLNQSSLQEQVSQYNSLLAQAIDTGNQGAVATITQTIDQLTAQLAQNAQAIQDNTAQMINQEAQFTQSRGQFQTGTLSGLGQIIQTIGQTTGFTDVASLKQLVTGSTNILHGTNASLLGQLSELGGGASGLASLLGQANSPQAFVAALSGANIPGIESGQSATWINTFESLVNNLTQNTEAIATNNQQLAQLNGQLLQPQQWATGVWSAFRTAIFSGMGNLLPQFQAGLPAGSAPTIAPFFGARSGGSATHIENLNINHAPTPAVDPQLMAQNMAFELSNAV